MRATLWMATLGLTAFAAPRFAVAGDDAKKEDAGVRLALTAPVEDVRAAVAERAVFDGIDVVFPPKESAVVLRRAGTPLNERDWLVTQLQDLDKALATRAKLRGLTDDGLRSKFDSVCRVPPVEAYYALEERDPVLIEIVRRGGDVWRDRLRANLDQLEKWRESVATDAGTRSWDAHDLEILTALRRVEGKPDPVRMEVAAPEPCVYPDLSTVSLRIVNHDDLAVTMTRGGDYRSGREGRYGVEARDAKGQLLPGIEWSSGFGGGMFARERKASGEGLGTKLPLSRYVAQLDPGEYRVRIHYSDWAHIADPDAFLGAVTVTSEAFTIRVLPRVIETTHDEQARLAALAEELPAKGPVQVLEGRYGPWAHTFVPPDSAAGRLLDAGWTALPALAKFASRSDADPLRRAWAFAVLHGITGRLAPTRTNVIGDFETHSESFSGLTGGGFSRSSSSVTTAGRPTIDSAAQADMATAWAKIATVVQLKETK